jgi:hypothetical protein
MAAVIRYVILLHTKTEKKYEVSQNTELSKLTTKFPPSNGDTKKNHGLDYFTETNLPKASN